MPEIYHFFQQLVNGLTIGSTYALIAIGYTMVYGIIGMINFAHGEVYMIGSYVAFIALAGLAMMGIHSLPLLMTAAFLASIIVTSAYGYSIERVAYRPLRGSNRLIPLISAIGMSIFLQNTVLLSQDSKDKSIPNLIPGSISFGPGGAQEVLISYMQILVFVVTLVAMLGLTLFISRSRLGRACRACAEDIKMANLLGINTNNIIALTFVIGAALAAVAAVLLSMQYGVISALRSSVSLGFRPAAGSSSIRMRGRVIMQRAISRRRCWVWPKPLAPISSVTSTRTSSRSACWFWCCCSVRPASWAVRRLRKYEQIS
jgi:branched-chain amino acid transport system permease protein